MYEDQTQEEYLIHDTPFALPHRFIAMCKLYTLCLKKGAHLETLCNFVKS